MSEDQKNQAEEVVIDIVEEVVEEKESGIEAEGLLPEEVEMAKKHNLLKEVEDKEDGTDKKPTEPEPEEDSDETPSFEEVEANEEKLDKYNKNEKALYFRWKSDKRKRQDIQKELEDLKSGHELAELKESVSAKRLSQIKEALADPDLTVEKLQAIIEGGNAAKGEEERFTKSELEAMQKKDVERSKKEQEVINSKVSLAEQIGRSKYNKFDDIVKIAEEVIKTDATGVKLEVFQKALLNKNIDEDQLADIVVDIARFSPKFKELGKAVSPDEQEKVDRAIKNSKKKISSASVGSSGGSRAVSESDLTPEDAVKMSKEQWSKLSKKTKDRLLGRPS